MNYSQHGKVLEAAACLALLVGCVEYDTGDEVAAETTRRLPSTLRASSTIGS